MRAMVATAPGTVERWPTMPIAGSDLLAELLGEARHALVLTGAGVSTESGLPDYRSSGGLWANRRFEELAHIDMWRREPEEFWRFYAERLAGVSEARPNDGPSRDRRARARGLRAPRPHPERRRAPPGGRQPRAARAARDALGGRVPRVRLPRAEGRSQRRSSRPAPPCPSAPPVARTSSPPSSSSGSCSRPHSASRTPSSPAATC